MDRPTNEPLLQAVMIDSPETLQWRLPASRWAMRCTGDDPHEINAMKAACMAHALELLSRPPQQRCLPQTLALVSRPDQQVRDPSSADIIANLRSQLQLSEGPTISAAGGGGGKLHFLPKNGPNICKGDAHFFTAGLKLTAWMDSQEAKLCFVKMHFRAERAWLTTSARVLPAGVDVKHATRLGADWYYRVRGPRSRSAAALECTRMEAFTLPGGELVDLAREIFTFTPPAAAPERLSAPSEQDPAGNSLGEALPGHSSPAFSDVNRRLSDHEIRLTEVTQRLDKHDRRHDETSDNIECLIEEVDNQWEAVLCLGPADDDASMREGGPPFVPHERAEDLTGADEVHLGIADSNEDPSIDDEDEIARRLMSELAACQCREGLTAASLRKLIWQRTADAPGAKRTKVVNRILYSKLADGTVARAEPERNSAKPLWRLAVAPIAMA